MKRFCAVVLMVILMFVLVACSDNQEGNKNNGDAPSMSQTEGESLKEHNSSTEQKDDTVDSTEEDNRGEIYWVSGSVVNFRKTPSTDGEVISQLTRGTEIVKLAEDGDWLYISCGETKGYIHGDYVSGYPPVNPEKGEVFIIVKKAERLLELWQGETLIRSFSVGLGWAPEGHKQMEGDGKTPEGEYYVCVRNSNSSFYLSLGVSYPNKEDAAKALADGRIDRATYERIASAIENGQRPDWNTALGGAIMIHGCGGSSDWTAGCVAVDNEVMDMLFDYCPLGTKITILP
ncbi:MAG: L,D-transpeptidase family protein [Agathobacter sp.]